MGVLPRSLLFACTWNAIRSPMAEGLMKSLFGPRLTVDSVGVRRGGGIDPFAVSVMEEIGIDISGHEVSTFEDIQGRRFEMAISLSPEAQHKAVDLTRHGPCKIEFWHMFDPSIVEGNRETRLHAYRETRDALRARLAARFGPPQPPVV